MNNLFTTTGITDSDRMIHTPGEFAKKNLLYVQEVGKLKSLQPHKSQRENLDSFLFLGILDGEGTITIGDREHQVKKGDCALINCMDYYAHESSAKNPWKLIWVHFNGFAAKAYYDLFLLRNDKKNIFRPASMKEFQDTISCLMDYQRIKDLEAELLSNEALTRLVNGCLLSVIHQERESKEEIRRICNEMRESSNELYQDNSLLETFTEKYNMNVDKLDQYFQQMYGITLRDYILNRRFTAAKELLRFTIKPVKDIIEESGIRNEDLFRKLFQDGEGMSAEEYRMKWSQWVK